MKIQVLGDDGTTAFSYDTAKGSNCLCPGLAEKPAVVAALTEATSFLGSDHHVIASIRADISSVIGRIEHELGASPSLTSAQTSLGVAARCLEIYVGGNKSGIPDASGGEKPAGWDAIASANSATLASEPHHRPPPPDHGYPR